MPGTSQSVYEGFIAAVEFYNRWRLKSEERAAKYPAIDPSRLSTQEEISAALKIMKGR